MKTVETNEIVADLAGYLQKVKRGESFVIADHNRPVAELRPAKQPMAQPRPFGLCKGQFVVPEDFDAPLPEDVLSDFEPK
jgi:antitoxin (DNA-binding transcriptional repressor) of toxin-antitoxin stability system